MSRPSWDDYFIHVVDALSARATCNRGRSAAVFVRDNDIIASGYVGSPPNMPHCDTDGHLWDGPEKKHCIRTIHAEQNAIIRAVRTGVRLSDTTVYCTMEPCVKCAMTMIGIGVYRVVAKNRYHDNALTRELFDAAGIVLVTRNQETLY